MRLLMVLAGANKGGAEKHFERLCRVFQSRHDLTVRALIRHNDNRRKRLENVGIDVHSAPFGGFFDFKTSGIFARNINDFAPDVVFTWLNRATKFCPRSNSLHVGRPGGYYDLKYYKKCDMMIAMTPHLRDFYLQQNVASEKVINIPNFADIPSDDDKLPADIIVPQNKKIILAMGRLHPNKGFDVLINAMKNIENAELWLLGQGGEKDNLVNLAAPIAEKIRFLPWQNNITPFMKACDVFVCPSRHEPFGSVIIEAWSHQKPLISSNSEGPSQVINNNHNGIIVPMGNHQKLATAINAVLGDADFAAMLAKNGYETFCQQYHETVVSTQYINAFKQAIENGKNTKKSSQ